MRDMLVHLNLNKSFICFTGRDITSIQVWPAGRSQQGTFRQVYYDSCSEIQDVTKVDMLW